MYFHLLMRKELILKNNPLQMNFPIRSNWTFDNRPNLIKKAFIKLLGETKSLHKRKDLLNIPSISGFCGDTFVSK